LYKILRLTIYLKRCEAVFCVSNSKVTVDIIIFGGEKYTEPIVAGGPFVINSQSEIARHTAIFMQVNTVRLVIVGTTKKSKTIVIVMQP